MTERIVVVGVGNPLRGDDAVGLAVARRVRETGPAGLIVLERDGEPTALMEAWEGADAALVVDAVVTGAAPGTVHCFDVATDALPATLGGLSTHGLGVGEAIELGRALGRLPPRMMVVGVEAGELGSQTGLTPAVARAVSAAAAAVLREAA